MNQIVTYRHIIIAFLLAIGVALPRAYAFEPDIYAAHSVLSEGRWIKISVSRSGMHHISADQLKRWGFADPSQVNVYGYGAVRIPDLLSPDNYIDDLPQLPAHRSADGLYFYARGPESESLDADGHIVTTLNPFTTRGYYFLSDRPAPRLEPAVEGLATVAADPATDFLATVHHETETVSYGQSGHLLIGEDFRYTPSRSFTLQLPGRVADTGAWLRCSFATFTSSPSSLSVSAAGDAATSFTLPATSGTNYGTLHTLASPLAPGADRLQLELRFTPQGTVKAANLDAIDVNYRRHIALLDGSLDFATDKSAVTLSNAGNDTRVWDVTDPLRPVEMNTIADGSRRSWANVYSGRRRYSAWDTSASLPSPEYVSVLTNTDLHGNADCPDMVIFTPADWIGEAERIAAMHASGSDRLNVMVVDQDHVFNEFASGSPDPGAFRRMLKMLYDRGNAAGSPLRYAMFFGRTVFDNRRLTPEIANSRTTFMPGWQTDESMRESESFTSDDIFALLDDGSGSRPGIDPLSIAVGRVPVSNVTEARLYTDKLLSYTSSSPRGGWKNDLLMVADDGDRALHLQQSENQLAAIMASEGGPDVFYNKVYLDAYPLSGSECTAARAKMHRLLDEGAMWWNYIGHAAKTALSSENILSFTDINRLSLRQLPILYAATCSFMQWDGTDPCGGELLVLHPSGGVIACISATRTVYMSDNGLLSEAMGHEMLKPGADGQYRTIGDIYRSAKNRLTGEGTQGCNNKLRFVLAGDPAMRIAMPRPRIRILSVNGEPVADGRQHVISALQHATMTGEIVDQSGERISNFNGVISSALYDAERSVTTLGRNASGTEGRQVTFEEQGDRLFAGRDSVVAGTFTIHIAMPSEIVDNFRPAALDMYAFSDGNAAAEAAGCFRDFYVYGYDDSAPADTVPPVIETIYLNHESFRPGTTVNESPMLIACVSDNVGINLSSAGIGRQMTLTLDNTVTYTDVALYYTPSPDGTPGGTIAYPLSGLSDGHHTLTLKLNDTSGNPASATVEFVVRQGAAPTIFEIYSDANPASVEANFYLNHNRPDAMLTVCLSVYDMLGRMIWTTTVSGRSDMFRSAPVKWDLRDSGGRRVNRGIYIYRASIIDDGTEVASQSRRIAVTGR